MKKYIIHYRKIEKSGKTMPITDLQLDLLAEKTRIELEEKVRAKTNGVTSQIDETEVIIKCV